MKLIAFFLSATLVGLVKGQTDCDFDYVCDDKGSPSDGELTMDVDSPFGCYEACLASTEDTLKPNCPFWTYYEELGFKTFVGENGTQLDGIDAKTKSTKIASCRIVPDCDHRISNADCEANNRVKCASGPGSCRNCDKCLGPNYLTGATIAHWTCGVDMPYRMETMPPGTTCRTECPSTATPGQWTATSAVATCESVCSSDDTAANGEWSLTNVQDGADTPAPVTPTVDSECLCQSIVLGTHQLPTNSIGATAEEGARFYCDAVNGLVDGEPADMIIDTMDSTSRCQLFCNGHLSMDIRCVAGAWTEGITTSEDVYCWGGPLECDYNPGINMDVCTCTGTGDPNICMAEKACADGACLEACEPEIAAGAEGCFCENKTGGSVCPDTQICTDGLCATP